MSNRPIMILTLKQIIRLKALGTSNRKVAISLNITRKTVNKYVKRIEQLGLNYQDLLLYDEGSLEGLFQSPRTLPSDNERKSILLTWMQYIEKELKRVGVTRWNLWAEYKNKHTDGFAYSQFCAEYQKWQEQRGVVMHFEHKAGDKMYVDFTGKKLEIIDRQTGEVTAVEVLVAVLGASQYTYVEATISQKKEDFIGAVENALHFFGGVPRAIVADNLKSAVTRASKYEPRLNETFEDFALHYQTTILPTRARKPRDKSLVEGAVNIVYNRIFSELRNTLFFNLSELNRAIWDLLENYNAITFQGKDHSRLDLFKQIEKQTLIPLPRERYEFKKYALVTVLKSSHVCLLEDKNYYSVHYKHLGQKVKLIYTLTSVEIYYKTERIAFHQRNFKNYKYTTVREHMPSAHNFVSDWNPEMFLNWAEKIGADTRAVVEKILQSKQHPEQAYKACVGILGFARKVGNERLNNACSRGIYYQSYNYYSIKNILDKGLDKEKADELQYTLPLHDNIRGENYYQ
jgi:transposase/DNA-binding CsgD family transcriptional regulator